MRSTKKTNRLPPLTDQYFREYSQYLFHLLANLDFDIIEMVATLILERANQGKTLYFIGNGGSATTASHFATDLTHCYIIGHKPIIRAISLTENVALLTAVGNDKGYEKIFTAQISALLQPGDILFAISASGNSPNLISAVHEALALGGTTVGLVGFSGGELSKICDYVIHVRTEQGHYGPVEDVHVFIDHMITSYLGLVLKKQSEKR